MTFARGFLADRARLVRDTVIPYQWEALNDRVPGAERSGTVNNFKVAAKELEGKFHGLWFQDSDLAKWLEAASYKLATHPEAKLETDLDEMIATIAKAQEADGYLDTYIQLVEPAKKWANLHEYHELYIAGHFIEAGVAHFEATGKRTLLKVVCKLADMIERTFGTGEGQIPAYCGHEEIELALLKLARTTGEKRYAQLAAYFINQRGASPNYFEDEIKRLDEKLAVYFYHDRWAFLQAHKPVREQQEPVGHSVRAMYLYTAMADLARESRDSTLANACRVLWKEIVSHHLYITGGVGSEWMGEKFSERYDLPNDRAYAESCAGIGLMMFARRMLDLELRGEYGDIIERTLYNNVLAGMSHDGTKFFYVNPLEVVPAVTKRRYDCHHIKTERVGWFGCACCPPNIARTLASLANYAYSKQPDGLAIHLYADGRVALDDLQLTVHTEYPWDSLVEIAITAPTPVTRTLRFRIPAWCRTPWASLNGVRVDLSQVTSGGYWHVKRDWKTGDAITLEFPMPIERVRAHPRVKYNAGCVAIQRGPMVYCAEQIDNGANLALVRLPKGAPLHARFENDFLGGAVTIETRAARAEADDTALYSTAQPITRNAPLRLVPYCLWNNRGEGEMQVWLRES
ncbi:glycoside hydrolase family 127 protein [Oleiharenicola lentus]|uniref:glycoside hydrolase family 127 protein n=1 Tax=Oleiharenicola lentus TaxID=2508720 RepID=UPI003F675B95